jgi:hypothetical protein
LRKRRAENASGVSREGERERTADDVSKGALDIETGSGSLARDEPGGDLSTAQVVSGMEVARARFRLWCGTWEPVAPMVREKRKWRPHKRERTEAGHRDGVTRSSEEGPGMGLERRGDSVWLDPWVNPRGEEPDGESKTVQYFQARSLGGV